MQKKVFLISDSHIKSRLWVNFAAVQGDSYKALEQISENVEGDSVLITCGDTLDSNRPSSTDLKNLQNFYKKFTTIYTIKGNHDDCDPVYSSVLSNRWVPLSDSHPVHLNDFELFGIDYTPSKEILIEKLSNVRATVIESGLKNVVLIMHQAMAPFFTYKPMLTPEELVEILGNDVKVYVGDIHKAECYKLDGQGFICSPGPLTPQDIGQASQPQYYYTLDGVGNYTQHLIAVRDFHIVNAVEGTADLCNTLASLKTSTSTKPLKPVVVLELPVGYVLPKDIVNEYKDIFIIATRHKSELETASDSSAALVPNLSLDEAVEATIDEEAPANIKILKKVYRLISRTDVPDEELDDLLNRWGVQRCSTLKPLD